MIAPDLVPELHCLELMDEGLLVGAAVTLTSLDSRLQQLTASLPQHKTQVFQAMLEMLRWFAGPQIRNVSVSNALNATQNLLKTRVAPCNRKSHYGVCTLICEHTVTTFI